MMNLPESLKLLQKLLEAIVYHNAVVIAGVPKKRGSLRNVAIPLIFDLPTSIAKSAVTKRKSPRKRAASTVSFDRREGDVCHQLACIMSSVCRLSLGLKGRKTSLSATQLFFVSFISFFALFMLFLTCRPQATQHQITQVILIFLQLKMSKKSPCCRTMHIANRHGRRQSKSTTHTPMLFYYRERRRAGIH